MKLIYIANARIPTEKAHGVQIVKMCEAFARQGIDVELVLPYRINPIAQDLFEYYGVERGLFSVTTIPSIDLAAWGRFGFLAHYAIYSFFAFFYLLFKKYDVLFSREYIPLVFFALFGKKSIYEMHDFPQSHLTLARIVCANVSLVVTTNSWAGKRVEDCFGIAQNKLLVRQNGVSLEDFEGLSDRELLCQELGIPSNVFIVLYTGHLYDWKGAHILAEAAQHLDDTYRVVFVGGHEEDIEHLRSTYPSAVTLYLGMRPHHEIPRITRAADLAVLPNIPTNQHSLYSTSPLKLFEYMASRVPVIASDLPSIRDIVSEGEVIFVAPGDVIALRDAIIAARSQPDHRSRLAKAAYDRVKGYTWGERARAILHSAEIRP